MAKKKTAREASKVPELPIEVHRQIVQEVGMPPHPLQYIVPIVQRKDLRNLCLVNSVFQSIATEVLHTRVHVTPRNLRSFARRVKEPGRAGPPKVKFLSFVAFAFMLPSWEAEVIVAILQQLSPETITHVLFDMPLRTVYRVPKPDDDPESLVLQMTRALNQFVNVEEFISARDEAHLLGWMTGPVLWPHWPKIQRVALYNAEILEERFIEAVVQSKTLRLLCCLNPRLAGGIETDEDFAELIDQAQPELSFLFLDAENEGDEETDSDYFPIAKEDMHSEPLLHYVVEQPERVTLVDVDMITEEADLRVATSSPTDWFFRLAMYGRLWDLGRYGIPKETANRYLQSAGEITEPVEELGVLNLGDSQD
ncbi:hypothetical protein FRC04_004185 [Tulasnella sp. 424]|nr:hypothetical protein FRC04_004185 [Tulasnella sp. 424]KAG8981221.1 hypothetical protein FRC05_004123 [Tulasnella sp. 425]